MINRKGNAALIVSFILAAIIVIGLVVLISGPSNIFRGKVTSLPNFFGLSKDNAMLTAQQLGIIVQFDSTTDVNLPFNVVVLQKPFPGKMVNKGDIVYLTLNKKSSEEFPIPDFRNMSIDDAKSEIAKLGLVLGKVERQKSRTVTPNSVISQNPAPGTIVKKGDKVNFVVSKKVSLLSVVPHVTGRYYTAARKILIDRGFKVIIRYKTDINYDFDLVLSQYPPAGSRAKKGSVVTIYVNHEQ
ncbi:MAG: PASTA domain-containing protein [Proteobacteria bacterium]|nr:PASTA domain-containing protein [Pseudomonadota bacterium]